MTCYSTSLKLSFSIRMKLLALRRLSLYKSSGLIFIHIPKNAGTSITNTIYNQFVGHCRAKDIIFFDSHAFERLLSFSILRDPIERAASAYFFAKRGSTNASGAGIRQDVHKLCLKYTTLIHLFMNGLYFRISDLLITFSVLRLIILPIKACVF